jgi:hypothetical protein
MRQHKKLFLAAATGLLLVLVVTFLPPVQGRCSLCHQAIHYFHLHWKPQHSFAL